MKFRKFSRLFYNKVFIRDEVDLRQKLVTRIPSDRLGVKMMVKFIDQYFNLTNISLIKTIRQRTQNLTLLAWEFKGQDSQDLTLELFEIMPAPES